MRQSRGPDDRHQGAARRGRVLLYAIGGVTVAGAMLLDLQPSLAVFATPLRIRICALVGAVFLALGRFGSTRLLAGLGERFGGSR